MNRYLAAYLGALLVLVSLDAVWLGWVAPDFYRGQIGHLLADAPRLGVAAIFYALYLGGVVLFAVTPALEKRSLRRALVLGALFGLCNYMTYDLTNLATLRGWPELVVVVDLTWGVLLTAATACGGYLAAIRWGR